MFLKYLLLCSSVLPFLSFAWTSTTNSPMLGRFARLSTQRTTLHFPAVTASSTTKLFMSEGRKPGVAEPDELKAFVEAAGDKLIVADVRNPDADVEPGDQKSLAVAPVPSEDVRPLGQHLIWDRNTKSMPLPDAPKDTPIITHCGGGGRGQKAKDFLEANGFTNVLNGGGPKETDCWAEFGEK